MSEFIQYATAADYIIYGALVLTIIGSLMFIIADKLAKITTK